MIFENPSHAPKDRIVPPHVVIIYNIKNSKKRYRSSVYIHMTHIYESYIPSVHTLHNHMYLELFTSHVRRVQD